MVGLIEDERHVTTSHFKIAGDAIILVGDLGDELGASHFLRAIHGMKVGPVPRMDYPRELAVQDAVRALIRSRLVKSAHDCSEGGLAVALAESCMGGEKHLGATIDLGEIKTTNGRGLRLDQALFNETQSRIVLSVAATNASAVLMLLELRGLPARRLGTVGGPDLKITADGETLTWPLATLHDTWHGAIARAMEG